MTDGSVKSLERERFKRHLQDLCSKNEISDAAFADAVYQAVAAHGLAEDGLRDTFSLTKEAFTRWTMSKNLPQPMVRAKILSWINENI